MTRIRLATPADVPLIRSLIHELATYEREPRSAQITETQLLEDGFGPERYYECLIADLDARTSRICPLLPRLLHMAGPQSVSRRPLRAP